MDKDEITISKKKIFLLILIFIFILFKNQIHHAKIKIFYFIQKSNIFTQWGNSLKKDKIL
jgi:hypothetical protein